MQLACLSLVTRRFCFPFTRYPTTTTFTCISSLLLRRHCSSLLVTHRPYNNNNNNNRNKMPFGSTEDFFPAMGNATTNTIPSQSVRDEGKILPRGKSLDADLKQHDGPVSHYSVCSFNVLADVYCQTGHWQNIYGAYCSKEALEWKYRLPLIREKLTLASPDIICLQEVDLDTCDQDFRGYFDELGYDLVLQNHKRRALGHSTGNATLYKRSKFEKCEVEEHRSRALIVGLVIRQPSSSSSSSSADPSMQKQQQQPQPEGKTTTAESSSPPPPEEEATVVAEEKKQKPRQKKQKPKNSVFKTWSAEDHMVWVCNVHLQGDPYAADLRFNQINSSLKELRKLQLRHQPSIPPTQSLTHVVGDFNCGAVSAVYRALEVGKLDKSYKEIIGMKLISPLKKNFQYDYAFASANRKCLGYEPTTFAVRQMKYDCLDFLFFNEARLNAIAAVEPLTEVEALNGIPSASFPSDHALVAALFQISPSSSSSSSNSNTTTTTT